MHLGKMCTCTRRSESWKVPRGALIFHSVWVGSRASGHKGTAANTEQGFFFFAFASRIFWKFRTPPGPGLQKVPPDSQVLLQFHMDDCNINKLEQLLQRFHFTVLIGFYWNLSAINEYYIFQSKRPQGWWAESVLLRSVSKPSPRGAWGADLSSVHGRQHLSCIRIHSCHRRLLLMWLYFQKHRRLFDIFKWRNIVTAERWQRF